MAIIYNFVAFGNCPLKFGSGAFRGSRGGWWSDHPGPHSMTHTPQSQFMDHRCSSTSRWAPTALGLFWRPGRPGRPHSHMTLPTSYNGVWQNTQPTLVDSVMATRVWSRQLYFFFFFLSINISIDVTSHCCQSLATWTSNISCVLDKVGGCILSSHRLYQCLVQNIFPLLSQSLLLWLDAKRSLVEVWDSLSS